ncbi:IS66 family insertion sequence element accessory protein TnpB [Brevibacillus agri]|nr:IS66 family insertion sequence element accessory protein TnpB [Brevibacillus agri]WHX30337.1 IS66 family insertion sequence element accessory protein TnpB [Brevibacillus agri]
MLSEIQADRVYLACGSTDMRKSIDGLAVLVKEGFHLDPFSSALFVFCNRQRDKLKILYWSITDSGSTTVGWSVASSAGRQMRALRR